MQLKKQEKLKKIEEEKRKEELRRQQEEMQEINTLVHFLQKLHLSFFPFIFLYISIYFYLK